MRRNPHLLPWAALLAMSAALALAALSCSLVLDFEPCETSTDCKLQGNVCNSQKICGPCEVNADCAADEVCQIGEGRCVRECAEAAECAEGDGCVGGACGDCAEAADCRAGQNCAGGQCGPCALDADCGDNLICREGSCDPGCVSAGDCAVGQICLAGTCGPCAEDAQCGGGGKVCSLDGACADFLIPGCQFYPEVPAPNAVFLGGLLTLSGPNRESGQNPFNAIKLAVDEINTVSNGVGGNQNRPLAFLVCDDASENDQAIAKATHLARVARVPAWVGPAQSRLVFATAPIAIEAGTIIISPSATAVGIKDLQDRDLVWRTAPPDNFQAETMAYFATWRLIVAGPNPNSAPQDVAILNSDDAYGQSFANSFVETLQLRANLQRLAIKIHNVPYSSKEESGRLAAIAALRAISPSPDVVLIVGFEETYSFMEAVRDTPPLHAASYFLTDGTRSQSMGLVFQPGAPRPRFIFGSIPGARGSAAFSTYSENFQRKYGEGTPPIWTEHTYDAVYMLVYALAGVEGRPDGLAMAQILKRLSDPAGAPIKVGTENLQAAFLKILEGQNLNLEGASGPLDYDNTIGDLKSADILRWDLDPNESGGFKECEVASRYNANGTVARFWCNALCIDGRGELDNCTPNNAPP